MASKRLKQFSVAEKEEIIAYMVNGGYANEVYKRYPISFHQIKKLLYDRGLALSYRERSYATSNKSIRWRMSISPLILSSAGEELVRLVKEGKDEEDLAQHFKTSPTAIQKIKSELNLVPSKTRLKGHHTKSEDRHKTVFRSANEVESSASADYEQISLDFTQSEREVADIKEKDQQPVVRNFKVILNISILTKEEAITIAESLSVKYNWRHIAKGLLNPRKLFVIEHKQRSIFFTVKGCDPDLNVVIFNLEYDC